jgi:outer membrane protein TolC
VQDAEYQALVNDYTTTVLTAQADVESAVAAYRGAVLQTGRSARALQPPEKWWI